MLSSWGWICNFMILDLTLNLLGCENGGGKNINEKERGIFAGIEEIREADSGRR